MLVVCCWYVWRLSVGRQTMGKTLEVTNAPSISGSRAAFVRLSRYCCLEMLRRTVASDWYLGRWLSDPQILFTSRIVLVLLPRFERALNPSSTAGEISCRLCWRLALFGSKATKGHRQARRRDQSPSGLFEIRSLGWLPAQIGNPILAFFTYNSWPVDQKPNHSLSLITFICLGKQNKTKVAR